MPRGGDLAHNLQNSRTPALSDNAMTSEDNSPSNLPHPSVSEVSGDETITLFAPFEAQKPTRSLFQRSSEHEGDSSSSGVDMSKEIIFDGSDAQTSGNARVLFRKLKAAVSGSSNSSQASGSSSSGSSTAPFQSVGGHSSLKPPTSDASSLRSHRSKVSPTSSVVSFSSAVSVEQGSIPRHIAAANMEQSVTEDPKISLTSYSDAHSRRIAKNPSALNTGGGVARPQAQAVNKTEMLKRFGSIADNQVQV